MKEMSPRAFRTLVKNFHKLVEDFDMSLIEFSSHHVYVHLDQNCVSDYELHRRLTMFIKAAEFHYNVFFDIDVSEDSLLLYDDYYRINFA